MQQIGNVINDQLLELTSKNSSFWHKRAKNVGISEQEIIHLSCENAGALPEKVVKREQELKELSKVERKARYVSVEASSLECFNVFATDYNDHKLDVRNLILPNGKYIEIYAHKKFGQPRERDLNILLALFKIGNKNKYKEYKITEDDIKFELSLERGGNLDAEIGISLDRLGVCFIKTNNWWDAKKKKRVVAGFNFLQKYTKDEEEYTIRFSEWVEKNIEEKYLKKIDYISATKTLSGYSKIIYCKIIKLIGRSPTWELKVDTVLKWLGKYDKYQEMTNKQRNRNIKRYITKAVEKATKEMHFTTEKVGDKYLLNKIQEETN